MGIFADCTLWENLFLLIGLFLAGYYWWLMSRYQKYWIQIPEWIPPENFKPQTKVTILVPARNEEKNIEACLHALLDQNFPKTLFEIIIINDHSTDRTAELAKAFPSDQLSVLSLAAIQNDTPTIAYKKWAIEQGIKQATGSLLLTTDADCIVPPDWLRLMVSFYEKKKDVFIAAPVNFYQEKNTLEFFQSLDFVGMMGITGAGIHGGFQHMCNGANLAYEKAAFEAVDGFKGISGRASGDDMLLLQKMAKAFPGRIGFLKNKQATVLTPAMPTVQQFIQQRIRWASKSSDYSEKGVTFNLAIVFFYCWFIIFALLLIPFFGLKMLGTFIILFSIKAIRDYIFQVHITSFFNRRDLMRHFVPSFLLHILYIAIIGLLANLIRSYTWKGRKVR